MTKTNGFQSTTGTDRDGYDYVSYWSVYNQSWTKAFSQSEVPDREWAAQDAQGREMFETLPKSL